MKSVIVVNYYMARSGISGFSYLRSLLTGIYNNEVYQFLFKNVRNLLLLSNIIYFFARTEKIDFIESQRCANELLNNLGYNYGLLYIYRKEKREKDLLLLYITNDQRLD